MLTIGIDPGLSGAVAYLFPDGTAEVCDTPTLWVERNGRHRREYQISEMLRLLDRTQGITDRQAVVERVTAMPKQGVASMFTLGRGLGLWEALLVAWRIPYTLVSPVTWKRAMLGDMGKGKHASRLRAQQLFPALTPGLSRAKDDGRAEALLLAAYGRRAGA